MGWRAGSEVPLLRGKGCRETKPSLSAVLGMGKSFLGSQGCGEDGRKVTRQSSAAPTWGRPAPCLSPTALQLGPNSPPTPSARPGSHEEREVQRRTGVGWGGWQPCSYGACKGQGRAGDGGLAAPARPPRPTVAQSTVAPMGPSRHPLRSQASGFLTLSCFLGTDFANPGECASLGHFCCC